MQVIFHFMSKMQYFRQKMILLNAILNIFLNVRQKIKSISLVNAIYNLQNHQS